MESRARHPAASLEDLRRHPVLAVDLNHGHLAAQAVTPDGNPAGAAGDHPPGPGRAARLASATGGSAPPSAP